MESQMKQAIRELCSFTSGEPVIATLRDSDESHAEFSLLIFVRSISDFVPTYTDNVELLITLSEEYPNISPQVRLSRGKLFHPNFTAEGKWVDNELRPGETIESYILRLVRVLQFKEIASHAIGNRNAVAWYNKNADSGLFPSDRINYHEKPRIRIKKMRTPVNQEGRNPNAIS